VLEVPRATIYPWRGRWKRAGRASAPHRSASVKPPGARETRTGEKAAPAIGGVRELDTNPREVCCPGCGSPMPKLQGPQT